MLTLPSTVFACWARAGFGNAFCSYISTQRWPGHAPCVYEKFLTLKFVHKFPEEDSVTTGVLGQCQSVRGCAAILRSDTWGLDYCSVFDGQAVWARLLKLQ